jgi:hypothetical protein
MTARYTTETAVEAIRRGAADYLQKPVKIATLRARVAELIAPAELRRKANSSGSTDWHAYEFEGFTARSSKMWEMLGMLQRIAPHYRSVLIQGPTGAGRIWWRGHCIGAVSSNISLTANRSLAGLIGLAKHLEKPASVSLAVSTCEIPALKANIGVPSNDGSARSLDATMADPVIEIITCIKLASVVWVTRANCCRKSYRVE